MKKVFIIAEVGNLHNGSIKLARRFIKEVTNCGANAVKFQTHIFEEESLPSAPAPSYFKKESRKKYLERTAFSFKQWRELKKITEGEFGIEFISSVFSHKALDWLEAIGVKRHKIPSGEVTNISLLEKIGLTGKPVLLSSGMSSWQELDNAVNTLRINGCKDITVLQCSSIYPCPPDKAGLNIILELKNRYGLAVGFSDHTLGFSASIAAVVLGAEVIEKHFTLSRRMYGSDAKHSLQPYEFKMFTREIRDIEKNINSKVDKDKMAQELKDIKIVFEKSIIAKKNIFKGTVITDEMIAFKKPGDGLRADRYKEILGRVAQVDIPLNTKIKKEMVR
jgi:sialic acid synthase SpsE